MQTLALALKNRGEEGEPLPTVFRQFEGVGLKFRRGWLHLIAGAPGGGKSALASFMSFVMDYTGFGDKVPTLYFSADNDTLTFGCAALANALKITVNEAEQLLEEEDGRAFEVLDKVMSHLWVTFESAPSPRDIAEETDAFATVYGEWPHMIVIDNLMDVDGSGGGYDDERTTQDGILAFLKALARKTGAAVVVLAHVTGQYTNGTEPIPRDGLMNKVDKRPQIILTMHKPQENLLSVSVVKHRRGRAMPDGSLIVDIPWIPEKAWFGQ